MPELPEIETLTNGLRKAIKGKTIKLVRVLEKKKFRGTTQELLKFVIQKKVTGISRYAKWLTLDLSSGYHFVIHLKMTGQLFFDGGSKVTRFLGGHSMGNEVSNFPNSHTRVIFEFTDGSTLFFQDMRKFGYVELYSDNATKEYFTKKKLGREPIAKNYTLEYFEQQLQRRKNTSIKAALLDQTVVAGIGNIYADDALYTAKIKPNRVVRSLTAVERKALHKATTKVLTQAIAAGGTSFSHYYQLDGTLGNYWKQRKVYQRTGLPCKRCATPIIKTRVAGRGTHYCPSCQR